jgi:hypothetical protein
MTELVPIELIASKICLIRGINVMLDILNDFLEHIFK